MQTKKFKNFGFIIILLVLMVIIAACENGIVEDDRTIESIDTLNDITVDYGLEGSEVLDVLREERNEVYVNFSDNTFGTGDVAWDNVPDNFDGTAEGETFQFEGDVTYDGTVIDEKASVDVSIAEESDTGNAELSDLIVEPGSLNESFDSNNKEYTMDVDYNIDEIIVTAILDDNNASLEINEESIDSGQEKTVYLNDEGSETEVDILVTAEDGTTEKNYNIIISRAEDTDIYNAEIDPSEVDFDLNNREDMETSITWNDANEVESVIGAGIQESDWSVEEDELIIDSSFLEDFDENEELILNIEFDEGLDPNFEINIIDTGEQEEEAYGNIIDINSVEANTDYITAQIEFEGDVEGDNIYIEVKDSGGNSLSEDLAEVNTSVSDVTVDLSREVEDEDINIIMYETDSLENELDQETIEVPKEGEENFKINEVEILNDTVEPGDEINISVEVKNIGESDGNQEIEMFLRENDSNSIITEKNKNINIADGDKKEIGFTIDSSSDFAGMYEVEVSSNNDSDSSTFEIETIIENISIETQPQLQYEPGDNLDLEGLQVREYYNDGSEEIVEFINGSHEDYQTEPENNTELSKSDNETAINIIHNDTGLSTDSEYLSVSYSEGRVFGVVRDQETGEELENAEVIINTEVEEAIETTTTSHDGSYEIQDLQVGDYELEVERNDYQTTKTDLEITEGDNEKDIDLNLIGATQVNISGENNIDEDGDSVTKSYTVNINEDIEGVPVNLDSNDRNVNVENNTRETNSNGSVSFDVTYDSGEYGNVELTASIEDSDYGVEESDSDIISVDYETRREAEFKVYINDYPDDVIVESHLEVEIEIFNQGDRTAEKEGAFQIDGLTERRFEVELDGEETEFKTFTYATDVNDLGNIDIRATTPDFDYEETSYVYGASRIDYFTTPGSIYSDAEDVTEEIEVELDESISSIPVYLEIEEIGYEEVSRTDAAGRTDFEITFEEGLEKSANMTVEIKTGDYGVADDYSASYLFEVDTTGEEFTARAYNQYGDEFDKEGEMILYQDDWTEIDRKEVSSMDNEVEFDYLSSEEEYIVELYNYDISFTHLPEKLGADTDEEYWGNITGIDAEADSDIPVVREEPHITEAYINERSFMSDQIVIEIRNATNHRRDVEIEYYVLSSYDEEDIYDLYSTTIESGEEVTITEDIEDRDEYQAIEIGVVTGINNEFVLTDHLSLWDEK